ncbi:hypothetical protein [Streptomyces erythrochromogenes]|uniref:hypothetical protein n=1 Tax=Streptomyces erythrochromogenes TaxID=285574 RepID=UPI003820F249|nr:hypothetical protein OG489_33925 [Streptomyces erythrochromogenes]
MARKAVAAAGNGTGAAGWLASFMTLSAACHPPDDFMFVIAWMTCYNGGTLKRMGSFCLNQLEVFRDADAH